LNAGTAAIIRRLGRKNFVAAKEHCTLLLDMSVADFAEFTVALRRQPPSFWNPVRSWRRGGLALQVSTTWHLLVRLYFDSSLRLWPCQRSQCLPTLFFTKFLTQCECGISEANADGHFCCYCGPGCISLVSTNVRLTSTLVISIFLESAAMNLGRGSVKYCIVQAIKVKRIRGLTGRCLPLPWDLVDTSRRIRSSTNCGHVVCTGSEHYVLVSMQFCTGGTAQRVVLDASVSSLSLSFIFYFLPKMGIYVCAVVNPNPDSGTCSCPLTLAIAPRKLDEIAMSLGILAQPICHARSKSRVPKPRWSQTVRYHVTSSNNDVVPWSPVGTIMRAIRLKSAMKFTKISRTVSHHRVANENVIADQFQQRFLADFVVAMLDKLENLLSEAFCFYRCIRKEDRWAFVAQYLAYLGSLAQNAHMPEGYVSALSYLCRGGIELTAWIDVMEACQRSATLHNTYLLYVQTSGGPNLTYKFQGEADGSVVPVLFHNDHLESVPGDSNMVLECGRTTRIPGSSKALRDLKFVNGPVRRCSKRNVPLLAFGNSIPSQHEHEMLVEEFKRSSVVAKFKNFDGKNNPVLDISVLKDIFNALKTKLPSRFSYFTCLHQSDQPRFEEQLMVMLQERAAKHTMAVEEVLARVASGGIELSMWIEVMQTCAAGGLLQHRYALYRRAYWGENSNEFSENTIYSFYHCKLMDFVVRDAGTAVGPSSDTDDSISSEAIPILYDGYGHLNQLSNWFLNPSRNIDHRRQIPSDTVVY
jgi:hypothetical protein